MTEAEHRVTPVPGGRVMRPFWLSLALLSFTPLAVCSPPAEPTQAQIAVVQPGIEAEQRGDYGFALFTYRYWARLDVPLAQYRLARLYEHGLGTNRDGAEAAKWYRAASESGYQPAHTALARLYEQGRGVPQNDALAFALYEKAAAAGDPEAHYQAGRLLEQGRATGVDPQGAAAHYQAAADAGNVDAQLALAELSPTDRPVPEHAAPHSTGYEVAAGDGDPRTPARSWRPHAPKMRGCRSRGRTQSSWSGFVTRSSSDCSSSTCRSKTWPAVHSPSRRRSLAPRRGRTVPASGAAGRRLGGVQAWPSVRAGRRRAARSGRGADLVWHRATAGLRARYIPR